MQMQKTIFKFVKPLVSSLTLSLLLVSTSNQVYAKGTASDKPISELSQSEIESYFLKDLPKSRISKMRDAFLLAENAYKRGDEEQGLKIQKEQLKGYPLNIWLDYYRLAYNESGDKFNEVMEFINSGKQHELAALLKERYAKYFSEQRDYEHLSKLVGPKTFDESKVSNLSFKQKVELCRYYEANWPLNKVGNEAVSFANRLYLDLSKRPLSCQGFMALFDTRGYLTDKLILKRFEKAYVLRSYKETTHSLAKTLERTEFKERVEQQMDLYDDPASLFSKIKSNDRESHRAAVLVFKRYANLQPRDARLDLQAFIKKYEPSEAELVDIYQIFAQNFLGRNYGLDDIDWVDKNLPTFAWTPEIKEQRLRRAIYFAQWNSVYILIDHLSPDIQAQINWRYWKARSAMEIGKYDEGKELMMQVAKDRSFFGFYAAQTLGLDYPYNYVKLASDYSFPIDVANNQAAIRFMELYALDDDNAIYEWREIAKHSPKQESMIMAQWALQTGNIRFAIDYVVSSGNWDALDYRFPIAWRSEYEKQAKSTGVEISFLYGISRQESMLNPKIRSWAGAVGLMQLMPGTAKQIARKEKWKFTGVSSLTDPATNIKYGSTYLRWMLDKFDNNRVLAAAAYNAGPGRIPRWRSNDGIERDAAMFIECIPFDETRKYVQNVLLYDSLYNFLLTGNKVPLIKAHEFTYAY